MIVRYNGEAINLDHILKIQINEVEDKVYFLPISTDYHMFFYRFKNKETAIKVFEFLTTRSLSGNVDLNRFIEDNDD